MNNPLSVVHIASGDLWAGAEVQLYHLATELQKTTGITLHVVLMNHGVLEERLRHAGITVAVIDEGRHNSLGILLRLIQFLRRVRPQIIHTHRGKENVLGALASLFVQETALVQTVHGATEHQSKPWQVHKNLYAYMNSFCTRHLYQRVIAVSAPLASELANCYSAEKVVRIENGISVEEIRGLGAHPATLPGSNNRIKVGIVGRLVQVKRVDIFLTIAKSLSDNAPGRYAFYIFGDGPLCAELKQQALALGINEQIHFMGFTPNIIPFLAGLDLLLLTSDHEGLPMVLLEALSLSIPIIAPATGGITELLQNGKFGKLVSNNSHIHEYCRAISEYAQEPASFQAAANSGLQAVLAHYSAQSSSSKYLSTYKDISPSTKLSRPT